MRARTGPSGTLVGVADVPLTRAPRECMKGSHDRVILSPERGRRICRTPAPDKMDRFFGRFAPSD